MDYPEKIEQARLKWHAERAERLGASEAFCMSVSELSDLVDSLPKPEHGDRWGDWELNLEPADNPSLDYVGGGYRHNPYWIRLSDLRTWRGFNDWMHHLWEKGWGQESMGDFCTAVMTIIDLPYPGARPR